MQDTATGFFEGEVTGTAFGGQGIIRNDNFVVFLPYAAIGDTVKYEVTQKKKNFAQGKIINLVKESPQRITAPCPYYGVCGGCQLQHVNYQTQLEYKRQWIEDAFHRVAGMRDIVVPAIKASSKEWAYRRRISLTLKSREGKMSAGYIAVDNRSLVEIEYCPIFTAKEDKIIEQAREIVESLIGRGDLDAKLTILKHEEEQYVLHFHFKSLPSNAQHIFEKVTKNYVSIVGVIATSANKTLQFGRLESSFDIEGIKISYSPKAFIQNHPEQSAAIYQTILKFVEEASEGNILDLYSGVGISSLLIANKSAKNHRVIGIEANKEAVRLATENATQNKIPNAIFVADLVEKALKPIIVNEEPSCVIMNPPREGLAPQALEVICTHPPETLIYVSCMPSTLARDVKILCEAGYQVAHVEGFDMFPQTAHVETLVVLKKM